jgi:hypothetical protein
MSGMEEMAQRRGKALDDTAFLADYHRASLANSFHEKLIAAIRRFDGGLDQDHEVGMRLVTFGQAITFHVLDLNYHNPSLLFFIGVTEDGHRVQLVQHVSQLSFLLIALPKLDPNKPKRKFGFAPPAPAANEEPAAPNESPGANP